MLRKQSSDKDPADCFYSGADRLHVADLAWEQEGLTQSGIELLQEAVERYIGKNYQDLRQQTGALIELLHHNLPQFFPKLPDAK